MKTLVIIEQPLWREAMCDVLRGVSGDGEVSAATDLDEALAILRGGGVSLVLAAQSVPGLGERGLAALVAAAGEAPVVLLDARNDAAAARRAAYCGARGYIPMTDTRELIAAAIGLVLAGGAYFPQAAPSPPVGRPPSRRLSRRQVQVLDQLLQGRTNREIAEALGISLPTVKLHVHAILAVTGARNRTEAALLAKEGWLADAD